MILGRVGQDLPLKDGRRPWKITCQPHVAMKLKRCFTRLGDAPRPEYVLSDTPENARDLQWFLERYPLVIGDGARVYLDKRAKQHKDREALVAKLLRGERGRERRRYELATPAREYQQTAARLALASQGLVLADDLGLGKQQPVDARVLTPTGYREIGALAVGDMVIGSDGRATKVIGVYPQGVRANYRVHLSDGASVEAGDEHLWTVAYYRGGRSLQELTLTTQQIRTGATVGALSLAKTALYVPLLSAPVRYEDGGPLQIQPYTLGQLIANGCLVQSSATLTVNAADWPEIRARLTSEGTQVGAVHVYGNATRAGILELMPRLRALGLDVASGEKRIPANYMRALPGQRIALLQGLMDGDGSCTREGNRVTYHTSSPGLAADVRALVQELGGVASVRVYDRGDSEPPEHRVRVRLPPAISPFTVARKSSRYAPRQRHNPTRRIVRVAYSRDVASVCIRVAAADHLYATEDAILTHNTASAICMLTDPRTLPAVVVTKTELPQQWRRELRKFLPQLRAHVLQGTVPYDLHAGCRGAHEYASDWLGGQRCMWCGSSYEEVQARAYARPDVVITSYSKIPRWAETLAGVVRLLVFDEAQELRHAEKKKGEDTAKYAAARMLSQAASHRMLLTATPVYNYGSEIFNVVEIAQPGVLGSFDEFRREWGGERMPNGQTCIDDPKAFGLYMRQSGIMLRRTRAEVGRELPALNEIPQPVEIELGVLERVGNQCAELARFILGIGNVPASVQADPESKNKAAHMLASEQFINKLRQATGLAKAPYVAEFVRMLLDEQPKVLLFGWHRLVYDVWREKLADFAPLMYTGTESPREKDAARNAFVEGDARILIMSLRSGAGLDGLQDVCSTCAFGELDWSPWVMRQCTGRLHRDGQRQPVFAFTLVANAGADPIMADVLGIKDEQGRGIRDPDAELVERVDPDAGARHVKRLAEAYLAQRQRPLQGLGT